jgi:hypothetical protein
LFHQFQQFALLGLFFHAVRPFHGSGGDLISRVALKADALPGHDQLTAPIIQCAYNAVVDYFFDAHATASLPHIKKIQLFPIAQHKRRDIKKSWLSPHYR